VQHPWPITDRSPRRGTLLPAIAIAILVVGSALALVVDRLWLDAARAELRTAAEAAALASAARLADDDRINLAVDPAALSAAARQAGIDAASDNTVAGEPVRFEHESDGEIRIGALVRGANGEREFIHTNHLPTVASVLAVKARAIGNPVARLFHSNGGDAMVHVAASLSNHVMGLRPFDGANAPVLPLAVLEADPSGQREDTWAVQIEAGAGGDRFRFNRDTKQVEPQPDGLPEILLHFQTPGRPADEANAHFVDVGNGFIGAQLTRQIRRGWEAIDLAKFGGVFPTRSGESLRSRASLDDASLAALSETIGQKRIVLLYGAYTDGGSGFGQLNLARLAAGRIMAIEASSEGTPVIVMQPAVVSTRTAIVDFHAAEAGSGSGNPYVYKVYLTR
jgi:hypothetical protein